jgi:hypothetical protein
VRTEDTSEALPKTSGLNNEGLREELLLLLLAHPSFRFLLLLLRHPFLLLALVLSL